MTRTMPPIAGGATAAAERAALLRTFLVFGAFWGAWAAVLPDLRAQVGVDDGQLGLALGAVAVAALPAMPVAGRLMDSRGPRRLLPASMLAFALASALSAFATSLLQLVLALLAVGAVTGAFDVVLNTTTASWERWRARPLMALGHAGFSLGVLTGSVLTGLARTFGAGPRTVLVTVAVLLVAGAVTQPAYEREPTVAAPGGRGRSSIGPALLAIGALAAAAFLLEDAVVSWSALHLERTLGAPPWVGGLGPGLFAAAMAAGRLAVHRLTRPGREAQIVAAGAAVLVVGVLLLALAPVTAVALVGMVLAGAGVSVLAPTLLSAAGARSAPGRQGADLALVTTLGYVGFVAGPPVVGVLSAVTSLPTALALLAVLPAAVLVAGPAVLRAPASR